MVTEEVSYVQKRSRRNKDEITKERGNNKRKRGKNMREGQTNNPST